MKSPTHSIFSTFLAVSMLVSAAQSSATPLQEEFHFEARQPGEAQINYLLFLPERYNGSGLNGTKTNWPMILFLHGKGQSGTNLAKLKETGLPKFVESDPNFPFILLSPQSSTGKGWNNDTLIELVDHVIRNYRVDTNRIYLTGLSMGGYGVWSLAAAYPSKFAAVVPISGGGKPAKAKKLARLPIWVFHGAEDTTVPVQRSREMVAAIKAAGGNIKYTEYPHAQHDCWTQTYGSRDLYTWLLAQKR